MLKSPERKAYSSSAEANSATANTPWMPCTAPSTRRSDRRTAPNTPRHAVAIVSRKRTRTAMVPSVEIGMSGPLHLRRVRRWLLLGFVLARTLGRHLVGLEQVTA